MNRNTLERMNKKQKALLALFASILLQHSGLKGEAQDAPQPAEKRIQRPGVYMTDPNCDPVQPFSLSATQNQNQNQKNQQLLQPQFNPRTDRAPLRAPTRMPSKESWLHTGPWFLAEPGPLAYDLTICQDDPNFHPPYLVPNPEILAMPNGFHESVQNVRLWQTWADNVAMMAWNEWRALALGEFGCAEIDIKLNRDGTFQAKRGNYRYYSARTDLPVEQAPFLQQINPFLKVLQDKRVFRIPDSINMEGPTIDFQIQLGVREKDPQNRYSWSGFMNDWKWWTGTGLQVYHRIECQKNGISK